MNQIVTRQPMEPLSGNTFVFTGNMKIDRDDAKSKVIILGGRVTTDVSSKTTFLVAGDEPGPSKLEKAKALKIKILTEEEFEQILNENKCTSGLSKEIKTHSKNTAKNDSINWAEKYRPAKKEDLVGNKQIFDQLDQFIKGNMDKKAVLLSGSPGIGKTSSALLLCKLNNVYPIEFNASDFRSKKSIKDNISEITGSNLFSNKNDSKKILIMDEVDGMTSDRGGIPELVNLIKKTKILIICICNDKSHTKMRTLANYCVDLHCRKPDSRTILPRIKDILKKEGRYLPDGLLNEIILKSNGDFRYILNTIQFMVTQEKVNVDKMSSLLIKKNALKGTFEIAAELFQKKSISEKTELYFEDYSLIPLFAHENYLKCNFSSLKDLLISADSISSSDLFDAKIHGAEQDWSLMPYHAFYSCVFPLKNKILQKRIDFPSFLGQNSKMNKNLRILGTAANHLKFNMSRSNFRHYLIELLYKKFIDLLVKGNIEESIKILIETELTKDDALALGDILSMDSFKSVPTKNKTLFTREYNKLKRVLPYTIISTLGQEGSDSED